VTDSPLALVDQLNGSSSVLLFAPLRESPDDSACIGLLTRDPPGETNVLSVTFSESPSERLSIWQREADSELPTRATIVDAREAMAREQLPVSEVGPISVRGVPENATLDDIGLVIASRLGAWRDADSTTLMCLHSVTALLATYEPERVIGLITSLNDLCEHLGVVAHHHIDPDEHDEETVATLRPLYDAVVEYTPEDGWIPRESERATTAPTFRPTTPPPGGAARTDPERPETVPMRYSFDTILELLSSPLRRTLLYSLKNRPTDEIALDRLVEEVYDIDRSLPIRDASSREETRSELVQTHFPKLREAGVIRYDPDSETVHYTTNRGLESVLRYVETVELG
jgi:hypothetical protein